MRRELVLTFVASAICLPITTSCSSSHLDTRGTVSVNGKPLETGSIHFQPAASGTPAKGAGAVVANGEFRLQEAVGLAAGKYAVRVDGFKTTGRMVADPQRGQVPERAQFQFRNLPLEIEVTEENSNNLQINLETGA